MSSRNLVVQAAECLLLLHFPLREGERLAFTCLFEDRLRRDRPAALARFALTYAPR